MTYAKYLQSLDRRFLREMDQYDLMRFSVYNRTSQWLPALVINPDSNQVFIKSNDTFFVVKDSDESDDVGTVRLSVLMDGLREDLSNIL